MPRKIWPTPNLVPGSGALWLRTRAASRIAASAAVDDALRLRVSRPAHRTVSAAAASSASAQTGGGGAIECSQRWSGAEMRTPLESWNRSSKRSYMLRDDSCSRRGSCFRSTLLILTPRKALHLRQRSPPTA